MLFSSILFLYYFLPVMVALYYIAPGRVKNAALILGSIIFYAWGEPRYVLVMAVSIVQGYVLGLLTERCRGKGSSRAFCTLSVCISLSFLLYFKYADFFIENINGVTGISIPLLRISLPVGISFYTFQIISYNIDVFRGETAQRNIINLAAYIAMFPQLVAGPIVRYADISAQLEKRRYSFDLAADGICRFVVGLAKKVLFANQLGELCSVFAASEEKSVLFYWLYAVGFTLQIYFDFSGYSDMAIGLGKLFGFQFPENFRYPYCSASMTEFWRRWHISLGSWFRDYVYIPLGGNRVGRVRQIFNILIVWALTGLWHGAAWNFVLWGLLFAVLLVAEKTWLLGMLEKSRALSHIYVLFFVIISFVLFGASGLGEAVRIIGGMFGAGGVPVASAEAVYYVRSYAVILGMGIVGATPFVSVALEKWMEKKVWGRMLGLAQPVFIVVVMMVVTGYLVDGSFQPFLYFRF